MEADIVNRIKANDLLFQSFAKRSQFFKKRLTPIVPVQKTLCFSLGGGVNMVETEMNLTALSGHLNKVLTQPSTDLGENYNLPRKSPRKSKLPMSGGINISVTDGDC